MSDWTPIERTDIDIRGIHPKYSGLLDVRIALSRRPEDEWCEFFNRPMGVETKLSMHRPELTPDSISIRPPDDEVEDYVRHVDERIDAANWRYQQEVLPRLEKEAEERQRKDDEDRRRIEDARRRIEDL